MSECVICCSSREYVDAVISRCEAHMDVILPIPPWELGFKWSSNWIDPIVTFPNYTTGREDSIWKTYPEESANE